MTTPALSPSVRRIRSAARRLEKLEQARIEAMAERNAAFAAGREEGLSMSRMAREAGVSTEAVAKVLRPEPADAP